MQKTVLSFGETLWDLLPSGPALGGAPFNLACRMHALGDRGTIVTRIGRDQLGREATQQIARWGMDASQVQVDDHHPTGTVKVTLDEKGNPEYFIVPKVAYDFIEVTGGMLERAAEADCICFGTLAQRSEPSRSSLHRLLDAAVNAVKFLDINLRKDCYFRETITESLTKTQVLKLNLSEAHYLADLFEMSLGSLPDFCTELMEDWSLSCCLVTLGEHGALAASADGKTVYVPGYEIDVVDTCGSGDAFSAGFIHEHLRGKSLAECCQLGNALGAIVAMQRAATTPIPMEDIRCFLNTGRRRVREPSLRSYEAG